MILGHDFHSEAAFERSYQAGSEYLRGPTWSSLLRLLSLVSLPPEQCFFTNAYMGLRQGTATTGRFPGSRDPAFVERCRQFLLVQLETQRPRVILTLGTYVPAFLAPLSPTLVRWRGVASLTAIDRAGPVVHDVNFPAVPALSPSVVALTHPSLRGSNVRHRTYGDLRGHDAEIAMLRDALDREAQHYPLSKHLGLNR
jgi:uracil-DNA glycosylase